MLFPLINPYLLYVVAFHVCFLDFCYFITVKSDSPNGLVEKVAEVTDGETWTFYLLLNSCTGIAFQKVRYLIVA